MDPNFTAAYFDHQGLYAFARQPDALYWNLARFAECLAPLGEFEQLKEVLETYPKRFETQLGAATMARLGLVSGEAERDYRLANLFYAAQADSGCGFEQSVFDMAGGARPERIASSPQSGIYASDGWKAAITALQEREATLPTAEAISAIPPGEKPRDMLIDEVEAIWAEIDQSDDWQAFNDKIKAIRASHFYA